MQRGRKREAQSVASPGSSIQAPCSLTQPAGAVRLPPAASMADAPHRHSTRATGGTVALSCYNWTPELGAMVLHGIKTADVRDFPALSPCEGKTLGVRLGYRLWTRGGLSAELTTAIAARREGGTLHGGDALGKIAGTVLVGRTVRATEAARMVGGWDELCARAGFAPGGIKSGQFVTFLTEPTWFHRPIAAAASDWSCVTVLELQSAAMGKRRARASEPAPGGAADPSAAAGGGGSGDALVEQEERQRRLLRYQGCQCALLAESARRSGDAGRSRPDPCPVPQAPECGSRELLQRLCASRTVDLDRQPISGTPLASPPSPRTPCRLPRASPRASRAPTTRRRRRGRLHRCTCRAHAAAAPTPRASGGNRRRLLVHRTRMLYLAKNSPS